MYVPYFMTNYVENEKNPFIGRLKCRKIALAFGFDC